MISVIYEWYKKYLSNPQVVIFIVFSLVALFIIFTIGKYLTPLFASLAIAYLLEGVVELLERKKIPRIIAIIIVFCVFLVIAGFLIFWLVPLLTKQIGQFVHELPKMISYCQEFLKKLPEKYPKLITEQQITNITNLVTQKIAQFGHKLLSFSLASVKGLINFIIYLVLVPVMSFFFLKDKDKIIDFFKGFLPKDIEFVTKIWKEVDKKITKFIQGKILEIFICWIASYIIFLLLDLKFSLLLSFLVGISVLVPYIGATVMFFPVSLTAYFQWGFDLHTLYVIIAYLVFQFIDGNILVPILMSGIVNLHPLAIIAGVLVFGGLWGFWGVLFSIPLATLIHAIIKEWPREEKDSNSELKES